MHRVDLERMVGEYEFLTEQSEGSRGPAFRSTLRLALSGDPPRLTGVEEYAGTEGQVFRQPVVGEGDVLWIGNPAAEGGPSQYRVQEVSATGFAGMYRTHQPAWLRKQQPGHPEWVEGAFSARRRSATE